MVDINKMDIEQLVKFINAELGKNKTLSVNKFCDQYGIKKSTLKSKMSRGGYSYNADTRQYVKHNITSNNIEVQQEVAFTKDNNTSNTTNDIIEISATKDDTTHNITELKNIDMDKLNILLNNIDGLLKLVEVKNNTSSITIDSEKTKVTSLRINEELYNMVKDRAIQENRSISDIVNRALLDYLQNYL